MSFLALEGSMPFLDCSSSFAFPQPNDFSSSSSLETGFVWDMGRSENSATSSLTVSPASPPASRLTSGAFPLALDDLPCARVQQEPTRAPLPLGLHGLKLRLDIGSVINAWHSVGGASSPFQLRGPSLAAAAATIPSTADLESSLAAASGPALGVSPAGSTAEPGSGACGAATSTAAAANASRPRDRRASRKAGERSRPAYPPRRIGSDKRPRIKGRFVTKAEFHQGHVPPTNSRDRRVPALVCA